MPDILSLLLKRFAAAVFPERCLLCGEIVSGGGFCCESCERQLTRLGKLDIGSAHRLAGIYAGASYEGKTRKALLRIKTRPNKRSAAFFAALMYAALPGGADFEALVPVPASAARLKERGYNQAELLADELSALLDIPVLPEALLRRESLVQHTLDRETRRRNAEAAYTINDAECVKLKRVLLVDDVLTTGATLAVCGGRLLDAGAASVSAVAATASL